MTKANCTKKETRGRRTLQHRLRGVSCALAGLTMLASQGLAHGDAILPKDAQVMTGVELYMLYRDKTWKWATGAGRMQDEGRVFTAWAGSGESATWAEGRWIVTDSGRLCLQAEWHTPTGTYPDKTCFSHKTHGGAIFQKREPSGAWYAFKNTKPTDSDEFTKLVGEDLVSAKLEAIHNPPQDKANPEGTPTLKQTRIGEYRSGEMK